jgi:acyl carrier protein
MPLSRALHHAAAHSVRLALANHLDIEPSELEPSQDLRRDLGLDPLDLVLVALRLEEGAVDEFPIAELETVRTIDDFAKLVRRWSRSRTTEH